MSQQPIKRLRTAYGYRAVYNETRHVRLCGNPGLCECRFMSDVEFASASKEKGGA